MTEAQWIAAALERGEKWRIVPKRDFGSGPGYWLPNAGNVGTGKYGHVKRGFVVVLAGCNAMPAATWFREVADAMQAIRVYTEANFNAAAFWNVWHKQETEQ